MHYQMNQNYLSNSMSEEEVLLEDCLASYQQVFFGSMSNHILKSQLQ